MGELTLVVLGTYLDVVIFNGMAIAVSCMVIVIVMMILKYKNR